MMALIARFVVNICMPAVRTGGRDQQACLQLVGALQELVLHLCRDLSLLDVLLEPAGQAVQLLKQRPDLAAWGGREESDQSDR